MPTVEQLCSAYEQKLPNMNYDIPFDFENECQPNNQHSPNSSSLRQIPKERIEAFVEKYLNINIKNGASYKVTNKYMLVFEDKSSADTYEMQLFVSGDWRQINTCDHKSEPKLASCANIVANGNLDNPDLLKALIAYLRFDESSLREDLKMRGYLELVESKI